MGYAYMYYITHIHTYGIIRFTITPEDAIRQVTARGPLPNVMAIISQRGSGNNN